jgi:hypothetical protein
LHFKIEPKRARNTRASLLALQAQLKIALTSVLKMILPFAKFAHCHKVQAISLF